MEKNCASYLHCDKEKKLLFVKKGYPVVQCSQCAHRFIKINDANDHLSTVYSDDYFFEGKDGYPNYLHQRDVLKEHGARYARIAAKFTSPGKLLDVGSAAGFIMKGFQEAGWETHGVEPNDTMASYGRNELKLDITTGSIESFKSDESFDLINMTQVIGHVFDLDQTLKNVSGLLRPGGYVLVESWNRKSLVARIMGRRWHEYSPPSVIHWYSDSTLKNLFAYYGMELSGKGYPLKKIVAEHAFSFLEGKTSNSLMKRTIASLNLFARKYAFIYPLLDVKWYMFRKETDTERRQF